MIVPSALIRNLTLIYLFALSQVSCQYSYEFDSSIAMPTIHVFSQHMSSRQFSRMGDVLTGNGFTVQENSIPVPVAFTETTIIYSPLVDSRVIETLVEILSDLGYGSVTTIFSAAEYHSYHRNNLGIYVTQ